MSVVVLHVLQGPERGTRFELADGEPQLIGRSSEALPLTDTTVSRRHAELTPDHGTWFVRDLESANGTFVNGKQLHGRVALAFGDQIRCGNTLLLFNRANATVPTTSALRLLDEEALDVTVESTADSKATASRILAEPERHQAASDHLRVIYELTALTAGTVSRAELLGRVMDLVFAEFKPDRGFILLGDDADAPLEAPVVRYAVRPKTQDEGRIPVSRTIIRHAMEKREGVLSTNAMNDSRFRSGDSVRDYGIRSALCAPITAGGRLFGVMHIDSQQANFAFTEPQLDLLIAIARHTGLALLTHELVASRLHTARLAVMGETVASLSHSIKNILQGLRGGADAVELALNRGDLDLAREGWPILARNLDRIYTLTVNMLAYSRPKHLELELTDIPALLGEVVGLHAPAAEAKGCALIIEVADAMPPVPVDVNGLHQALNNVLGNAIEAVPAKGGAVSVTARYEPDTARLVVCVTDNGPGIEADRHDQIFEAFYSSKGQRGTGLGLAVTKKIIEEHGGTVHLESEPGRGTSISLDLPTEGSHIDAGDTRLPRPMGQEPIGDF